MMNKVSRLIFLMLVSFWGIVEVESQGKEIKRMTEPIQFEFVAQYYKADSLQDSDFGKIYYRLCSPSVYSSQKKYPLVVCLHGAGNRGNNNISQLRFTPAKTLVSDKNREKFPCFIYAPQCPQRYEWGVTLSEEEYQREEDIYGKHAPGIDSLIFAHINELIEKYPIDRSRIYLLGQSLGGHGVWHFLVKYPNFFAAAVPICGGCDTVYAESISNVAIWAFHGKKDEIIPAYLTENMVRAISGYGGDIQSTIYQDKGHSIAQLVIKTDGLFEWLFSKKR